MFWSNFMYWSGILLGWALAILLSGEWWSEILSQNDLYYRAVILKSLTANHILAGEEVQKLIAPCALLNAHRAISAIILKNELVLHKSYLVWMQSEDAHGLFRFVR